MKVIAMDAGPSRFMLAEGTVAGRDAHLQRVFSVDIPTGSVADGIISDMASVRIALQTVLKANKVRTKNYVVTVNCNAMLQRKLEVPQAKDKDLHNLVTMEMRQYLPSGRNFTVDYITLGEGTSPFGSKVFQVKATALPAELCEGYYHLLQDIGLRPHKLDVNAQVLGRLFAPDNKINNNTVGSTPIVAVDISHFQTLLYVIHNGEVDLTRSMPVGVANLERMLADRMQSTPEEARTYIRNSLDVHRNMEEAGETARRFLGQTLQEVRKVQQYLRTKNITEQPCVYLYGMGSGINGMDRWLSEQLETPVETIRQHSRIKMPSNDRNSPLAHYLNAAGALLKG